MNMDEIAAMLGRSRDCKSIRMAMAVVAEGYDLVGVVDGGTEDRLAEARDAHPGCRLVVLARGLSRLGDRVGIFAEKGRVATPAARLF
jgi:hypothetical protein